jgi:hypothetical protein
MNAAELLDRYLLTGAGDKGALVATLLAQRSPNEAAAPLYRALEAIGDRTPDEALIALRIAIAGRRPDDEHVLTLRAIVHDARAVRDNPAAARDLLLRYEEALAP